MGRTLRIQAKSVEEARWLAITTRHTTTEGWDLARCADGGLALTNKVIQSVKEVG